MTTAATKAELRLQELFDNAKHALQVGDSIQDYEPAFVELLQYIKTHLDCRDFAEHLFVEEVKKGSGIRGVGELVEFCMHELRYAAVFNEAKHQLALSIGDRGGPPPTNAMVDIMSAYEDDWDGLDDDIYDYYSKRR